MKLQIKFLKDFKAPSNISKKLFKAESVTEIDADGQGIPTHSFWYEQLRQDENKEYFEKLNISQITSDKPKSKK